MDYFVDDTFIKKGRRLWDKRLIEELFTSLEEFKNSESEKSKERKFTEFFLELKMAYNEFLQSIKDLPMIMNCRTKGNIESHFGGFECASIAKSFRKSSEKYLSDSLLNGNFEEGSIENLVLEIRKQSTIDEEYAREFERNTKQSYLNFGNDNTLEILKSSGYNFN